MKGQIPVTSILVLESGEPQWMMLVRGLIDNLKTTALVEIVPGQKVRIKLIIDQIIPPEHTVIVHSCSAQSNMGENFSIGISKSKEFFNKFLNKTTWFLIGCIDGDKKIPIIIVHHQSINITVYTQKLKVENTKEFFPQLN